MTTLDLATVRLYAGAHTDPNAGQGCVMEMVSLFAGEPWTDHPACACPVITKFAIRVNDRAPDDVRQQLVTYIPRIAGSRASAEVEQRRGYLAATWAVNVFAPLSLDARGLSDQAAGLRAVPAITDRKSALVARAAAYAAADAAYAYAADAYAADAGVGGAQAMVWDEALACLDALLAVA